MCFSRILHDLLATGVGSEYSSRQSPQALIIAPTRELAIQIKVHQFEHTWLSIS